MNFNVIVYHLGCPLTGDIKYIGATTSLEYRLRQHITNPTKKNKKRITMLRSKNLKPIITKIQVVPRAERNGWEKAWMRIFNRCGFKLNNISGNEKFKPKKVNPNLSVSERMFNATLADARIVLDGEADFLWKLNTRSATGAFRIRFGISDSGIWFSSAGNVQGGGNDRVLDSLIFGNGQFPFPVVPHIWIPRSGSLIMDLQDISGNSNTIEFAFHGSKLVEE